MNSTQPGRTSERLKYRRVSIDSIGMKQINLKLPKNLHEAAERYVEEFGYRNIQELATESMREKLFEESGYDESFSEREIELIEELLEQSNKHRAFVSEAELSKVLRA